MNRDDFNELRDELYDGIRDRVEYPHDLLVSMDRLYAEIRDISDRKGRDYSGDADAFASFKRNANAIGLTEEQVWSVLAVKHWDALMTFVRDGKVESEGVQNRITDLILYLFLLHGMLDEKNGV